MPFKVFTKKETNVNEYPTLYYVNFVKTQQEEIIKELQKEIQKLRHENSDLKFQLYVGPKIQPENKDVGSQCTIQSQLNSELSSEALLRVCKKPEDEKSYGKSSKDRKEIERLEFELESATKLVEELKWVQDHCDNKMQVQELKLEELQKEMMELRSTELEIFTVQIPPLKCLTSRSTVVTPTEHYHSRRRRSSSASRSLLNERRSSLQSILPDNYRDSVATLPPISFPQEESNATTSGRTSAAYKAIIKGHIPSTKVKFMPQRYTHTRLPSPGQSPFPVSGPSHTLPMKTPTLVQTSSPTKYE